MGKVKCSISFGDQILPQLLRPVGNLVHVGMSTVLVLIFRRPFQGNRGSVKCIGMFSACTHTMMSGQKEENVEQTETFLTSMLRPWRPRAHKRTCFGLLASWGNLPGLADGREQDLFPLLTLIA